MKIRLVYLICTTILITFLAGKSMALPTGFVYLKDIDASIIQEMKYLTDDNFLGRPVKGYEAAVCILTLEAAQALKLIQQKLLKHSLSLKVYDCYRPRIAVEDFISWSKDATDQKMKKAHYPNIDKADFFKLGYVAEKSSHTRGSTVDLSIVRTFGVSGKTIDLNMGTGFDFMDELSHPLTPHIQGEAHSNRLFLRKLMQEAGFMPFDKEWWHFTLKNEPFPDTYFNFPVK
jgi:D-alanyl-D-alanine dipeptidase